MKTQPEERSKETQTYRRILLGYDGSENAKRALGRAIALTNGMATLLVLVAAMTILPQYGTTALYYPTQYADEVLSQAKKTLEEAIDEAKHQGVQATGAVKEGSPAEVILEAADKENVDLIVLGRRGMSRVERFLMGSVSSSVVGHSRCDVLVVK
jgi:nucleotide-binding universal stress UspA family protein